ncbi:MAG: pyridoxamine 5'-phosphate oxidase [Acetobacteraceae bacterium]|nr:pyridoxamine 5'-phosphate oxidase [Acetobacteraceae bacterium]
MSETDPFVVFAAWMAAAEQSEPSDPNAMTLATATDAGAPAARIVLLKGVDPEGAEARGFVFFTNRESRKGAELAANGRAALLFHWKTLGRQIRIEGRVETVSDSESDAYFATRARLSRLGAVASDQSRPLASRAELERRLALAEARYPGEAIPRPAYWGGYRVIPHTFEFWQNMPFRLHDRTSFTRVAGGWRSGKLYP